MLLGLFSLAALAALSAGRTVSGAAFSGAAAALRNGTAARAEAEREETREGRLVPSAASSVNASLVAECPARQGRQEVCHPFHRQECAPLAPLVTFRNRMVKLLLLKDLPQAVGFPERPFFEHLAELELRAPPEARLMAAGCTGEHVDLTLAMVCIGLLETEWMKPRRLRAAGGVRRPSRLANATTVTLSQLLSCPWSTVAGTGWPVFALLARVALRRANRPPTPAGPVGCQHLQLWRAIAGSFGVHGMHPPTSVWDQAQGQHLPVETANIWDFAVPLLHLPDWAIPPPTPAAEALQAACLWQAADELGHPHDAVCVSPLPPGAPRPGLSARDCNPRWPACDAALWPPGAAGEAEPRLQFWLQLPPKRDIAADSVREEQRPFCTLDKDAALQMEVKRLVAILAKAPRKRALESVEVGSTYGDCTFIVHAAARRAGWPMNATAFEPNPQAAAVFRASLPLNPGAVKAVRVREAAVGSGDTSRLALVIPVASTVHASLRNEVLAVATEKEDGPRRVHEVEATSIDREFGRRTIDLLMIVVSGGELHVLEGAKRMLSEHRAPTVVAFTWQWPVFKAVLEGHGYRFVWVDHYEYTSWVVARAPEPSGGLS